MVCGVCRQEHGCICDPEVPDIEWASILVTADCHLRVEADRQKRIVWLTSEDRFYEEGWSPEAVRCLIAALETALALVS